MLHRNTDAHKGCHCTKAESEHSSTPINISLYRGDYIGNHSMATIIDKGALEFIAHGSPEQHVDLEQIKLHMKLKITEEDESNLADDANISTVNLLVHSLF